MANIRLKFRDKYFEHDGKKAVLDKGLTIGGYKSAWLIHLVAPAYVLEKTKHLFLETAFYGIYHDDSLVIFIGILSMAGEISLWRKTFQQQVNIHHHWIL
jgi:hypothetical protein